MLSSTSSSVRLDLMKIDSTEYSIVVVGEKEVANRTVNVRTRDNKVHGEFTIDAVAAKFQELAELRILKSEEYGWSPPSESPEKEKSETPVSE